MKKTILNSLLLLVTFVMVGCGGTVQQQTAAHPYQIYRLNSSGTKLVEEGCDLTSVKTEEQIEEMIAKIMEEPVSSEMQKVLPESVHITGATIQNQDLILDFNGAYKQLEHVQEVLCRAGIVKTLVQISGVTTVEFTVDGQELVDVGGTKVGPMTAELFLDSKGEGINPYQYATLTLYFPDESGEQIVKELRDVYYSSNNTLEKVVVEEVLKGPENTKLQAAVGKSVKVLSVTSIEGMCTITLDQTFNQQQTEANVSAEATIYALVNAVCDSTDVKQVQIQIEENTEGKYLDTVDISKPLVKRESIIYHKDNANDAESEVKKPSVGADQLAPDN